MHNTTRRFRRFKQPLSSIRESPTSNSNHVRHRQLGQPDTLRGAMLVAIVVVTVVLYFILRELERSSFVSVPRRSKDGAVFKFVPSQPSNVSDDRVAMPSGTLPWPPHITGIPEEHAPLQLAKLTDNNEDEITTLPLFDARYCHGSCRFLLPVRIGEQESKARTHLVQLLSLAKRLNRTVVLPNVGKSRMSVCSEWSFDAYYDTSGFTVHGSNLKSLDSLLAIDLDGFAKWVDGRPVSPNGVVVSMHSVRRDRRDSSDDSEDVPFVVEQAEVDPKVMSCLGSRFTRLRSSLPETTLSISFDSRSHSLKNDSDASSRLVQLLSSSLDTDTDSTLDLTVASGERLYQLTTQYTNYSSLSLADIDVLVLDYDLRRPLFDAPEFALANFNLHYATKLYDLADRLSENLGPFLGVHWRMETVPVQNLAWCAASLVSTLQALLEDDVAGKDIQHVWIATDYPHPLSSSLVRLVAGDLTSNGKNEGPLRNYGPSRKSSTFKAPSVEHNDAIGIFSEAFRPGGDLEAWKLTDLANQLRRYPYVEGKFQLNEMLLDDSGVFGILDKLVIVQASVFVTGSKDCSKTSSFSKQVIEARRESFEAGAKGTIRNVVEYFGSW